MNILETHHRIDQLGLNPTERTVAHLLFFLGFREPMQAPCDTGFGWVDQDGSVGVTTPLDWEDFWEGKKNEVAKMRLFVDETEQDLSFNEFRDYILKLFDVFDACHPEMRLQNAQLRTQFLNWMDKLTNEIGQV